MAALWLAVRVAGGAAAGGAAAGGAVAGGAVADGAVVLLHVPCAVILAPRKR